MEICAQTTEQKHKHSSPRQRLSPSWRQDQRRLCSSQTAPICTAITRIRKSRRLHLTKFNTKFKQPDIKNNSRTSMDTCTYRQIWKRSDRSAGERGKQKQQPKSKLSYQEAKTLIRNNRLADFKHRNGGYNPQQDTLRLLSRHEQTMIFRLKTGHCRLRRFMKKIGIEKSALCPCRLYRDKFTQRKYVH